MATCTVQPSKELRDAASLIRDHHPAGAGDWKFWRGLASMLDREAEAFDHTDTLTWTPGRWNDFNVALGTARAYAEAPCGISPYQPDTVTITCGGCGGEATHGKRCKETR